ncbi:MAG TPA: class II aldolase/adducin family protein [Planctomycetota bacterium]|nr:class II aldolase/adducin family protein [Planctomycetota bacterium]
MTNWTERTLRTQIQKACQALSQRGLVAATDGNVSARLGPDRVLITPSGISKGDVTELNIMLCDMDGRKIRGRGEISSEVHVHLAAYRSRDDIGAVVHAHPPTATAFTFAGMEHLLREPIVPEVTAQIGPIPSAPYVTPGSRALAEAFAPHIKTCDIVMLSQHGAVAVGKDPWAAYLRMEKLEHFAMIVKAARELSGSGDVKRLDEQQIDELMESYGKGKLSKKKDDDELDDALIERIASEVLQRLGRTG